MIEHDESPAEKAHREAAEKLWDSHDLTMQYRRGMVDQLVDLKASIVRMQTQLETHTVILNRILASYEPGGSNESIPVQVKRLNEKDRWRDGQIFNLLKWLLPTMGAAIIGLLLYVWNLLTTGKLKQ